MTKIQVLLSTYNGEKYLETQLESLEKQNCPGISVLARDDGSTDRTIEILRKWQGKLALRWYCGENRGPAKSFLNLIKNADNADYYALCDQDDYWESNKIQEAIKVLSKIDLQKPAVYYSWAKIVDADLNDLDVLNRFVKAYHFGGAIAKNNVTGCTMVFNKKLLDMINLYDPKWLMMHDQWIYLVCLALDGYVYYDQCSYILYRQHKNNVIGAKNNFLDKIFNNALTSLGNPRQRQAMELYEGYACFMSCEKRNLLQKIIYYRDSFAKRITLAIDKELRTGSMYDIWLILSIILGKF